jgi:bloom syndrome protein
MFILQCTYCVLIYFTSISPHNVHNFHDFRGHDFRVDYKKLTFMRDNFPTVPIMALTATADQKVVSDAIQVLGMTNVHVYRTSFNRSNLKYQVIKKDACTVDYMSTYISQHPSSTGVIYCLSRQDCESLSHQLSQRLMSI